MGEFVAPYIDTSALAKWFLSEAASRDVGIFLNNHSLVWIGRVGVVEFESLLARRMRAGEIDEITESSVIELFERRIFQNYVRVLPIDDAQAQHAAVLLRQNRSAGLRTLDALHLAAALRLGTDQFVTADAVQAKVARDLGLTVTSFG